MSASVKMRAGRSLARLESSSTKSLGLGFGKEPELLKWQMDAVIGRAITALGLESERPSHVFDTVSFK